MGAIGLGTGILLAVTIIYQYFETSEKERAIELGFFVFLISSCENVSWLELNRLVSHSTAWPAVMAVT
jgi:hypothetical protein